MKKGKGWGEPIPRRRRLATEKPDMHELASPFEGLVNEAPDAVTEFEARLPELGRLALRVAYSVLRSRADAEDVAQDALVRAFRNLHSLRDPGALKGWLVRTAFRLALDEGRRRQRRGERGCVGEPAAPGTPADELQRVRLLQALDALPDKLRLTLTLSAIEGHAVREVATLLGVPEGTVKSRLHLARRRLAERMSR
jgi:RNA polymerase sigma-70 factor (ECF subfamily)